jgi:hypothetical protein
MKQNAVATNAAGTKHKIVITRQDGTVTKGYFCAESPVDLNSFVRNLHSCFHEELHKRYIADEQDQPELDLSQLKAVFFVSSFQGDNERDSVRFYTSGPEVQNIWVEIGFNDGEVIEGCVRNSLDHLKDDGFFLYPSSPESNNLLLYVDKSAIVSYRVLGFRMLDDENPA